MLILVRHAMPAFGPDTPPELWELADEGRRAAELLRDVLPPGAVLVAGTEPKMRQTLEPAGLVSTDVRFNEVDRDEPFEGDFRARRRGYLEGDPRPGWERHGDVIGRFDAGVQHWLARAAGQPLVVATGGMAMTLWLTTQGLADPGAFWADLRLPDPFEIRPADGTASRLL